jgi:hypothetical protein
MDMESGEGAQQNGQKEVWELRKAFTNISSKPYINMVTAGKVLQDDDYSITSIMIMIVQL